MTANIKRKLFDKIYELYGKEKWLECRLLLLKLLETMPNDHWLLTRIGNTYYEERNYIKALEYSKKAFAVSPNCPLVLWDLAGTYDMLNKKQKAINIWLKIVDMDIIKLAYGEHGEGLRWANSLKNNCRYRLALTYNDLKDFDSAKKSIIKHLKSRKRGLPSVYKKLEAEAFYKKLKQKSF